MAQTVLYRNKTCLNKRIQYGPIDYGGARLIMGEPFAVTAAGMTLVAFFAREGKA
jgi:hypothetical protein